MTITANWSWTTRERRRRSLKTRLEAIGLEKKKNGFAGTGALAERADGESSGVRLRATICKPNRTEIVETPTQRKNDTT